MTEIELDEVALTRTSALNAINALKDTGVGILGGDVYLLVGDLEDTYNCWTCNSTDYPDADSFLSESLEIAAGYVKKFPEPKTGTILFVLVLTEEA